MAKFNASNPKITSINTYKRKPDYDRVVLYINTILSLVILYKLINKG